VGLRASAVSIRVTRSIHLSGLPHPGAAAEVLPPVVRDPVLGDRPVERRHTDAGAEGFRQAPRRDRPIVPVDRRAGVDKPALARQGRGRSIIGRPWSTLELASFFKPLQLRLDPATLPKELPPAPSASWAAFRANTSRSRSAASFFHRLTCTGCSPYRAAIEWTGSMPLRASGPTLAFRSGLCWRRFLDRGIVVWTRG
jgi:hypothetical protein